MSPRSYFYAPVAQKTNLPTKLWKRDFPLKTQSDHIATQTVPVSLSEQSKCTKADRTVSEHTSAFGVAMA